MGRVNSIFALLLLFTLSLVKSQNGECNKRYYGQDSFVCVCDENGCDYPGITTYPEKGKYIRIISSRDHYRFFSIEGEIDNADADGTTININTEEERQPAFGFGGAFTDATGINVLEMSETLIDHWIKSHFAPEGIEYNFCRVPIAGSDFSTRPYSYADDVKDDVKLESFALQPEDYKFKFPLIKGAINYTEREFNLMGSPWSPPAWMKENGMHNGSGGLLDHMWDPYSSYLIKFVKAYEAEGIPIWGVTPQNEPLTGFEDWFWNTCAFSAETMRDWIKTSFGPALEAAGLRPRLQVLNLDHNRDVIPEYPETAFVDPEAEKFIDGTALHWYADHFAEASLMTDLHNLFPNKYIMYTEACEGWNHPPDQRVLLGSWERAQNYSDNIIDDLNHWSTGWIDWNMALSPTGGPNWADNFVDSPTITNQTEFVKQPTFYAMGHFSKYIEPGDAHLAADITLAPNADIKATTFKNEKGHQVIIILNKGNKEESVTVQNDGSPLFRVEMNPKSIESILFYP